MTGKSCFPLQIASPSLRGSGLKFFCLWFACKIAKSPSLRGSGLKLHFTRILRTGLESPSLRGSGLKYNLAHVVSHFIFVSLFTREWIEISSIFPMVFAFSRLPLYEGVDWNIPQERRITVTDCCLPLYEGVDWNLLLNKRKQMRTVSLFTREWIEILMRTAKSSSTASPSLRGSGLKFVAMFRVFRVFVVSPSLRGSGLKYHRKLVSR